jgi:uncharacterized protein (DUF1778 family)
MVIARSERWEVKFHPHEINAIIVAADREGLSVAAFIRQAAIRAAAPRPVGLHPSDPNADRKDHAA